MRDTLPVVKAIKLYKTDRAPGPDELYMETIKLFDEQGIDTLVRIFNAIHSTGR